MVKDLLIIIDTESGFVQRFRNRLEPENIDKQFNVVQIIPDTSLSSDQLIEKCISELRSYNDLKICGIFVDIVIYEKKDLDKVGIELAKEVKKIFPQIPTFNITGFYRSEKEMDLLADATLEIIDGVFPKNYLEGEEFSAKRLNLIFQKARMKIENTNVPVSDSTRDLTTYQLEESLTINYSYTDQRVKSQIIKIGEYKIKKIIDEILPSSEGTLSYLKPGRSGAYVFKLDAKVMRDNKSPTRPKSWILKISENKEIIEREIRNYKDIQESTLNKLYYPMLLGSSNVGEITGIMYELEKESKTLLEVLGRNITQKKVNNITQQLMEIFENLYGDPTWRIADLWKDQYPIDDELWDNIIIFFEENERFMIDRIDPNIFKRVKRLVETRGVTEKNILNINIETDLRNIHGDFNVRNILINNNNLVIIDFASFDQGHIVKDIAKLERDIIYKVVDSSSSYYLDWSRIDIWRKFSEIYSNKNIFQPKIIYNGTDKNIRNILYLIKSLRNILIKLSPRISEKEYLLSVLYFTLLSLVHPEISIHKKVVAIDNISLILNVIQSTND